MEAEWKEWEEKLALLAVKSKKVFRFEASPEEMSFLARNVKRLRVPESSFGLRGLRNLGSTCYLSSVLQVLSHSPPFRNYFLSDLHNSEVCARSRNHQEQFQLSSQNRLQKIKDNENDEKTCIACEMDKFCGEMYNGENIPFSPSSFLRSIWIHDDALAGYEMQDAHEFYISVLNGLHLHAHSATSSSEKASPVGYGLLPAIPSHPPSSNSSLNNHNALSNGNSSLPSRECSCPAHQICGGTLEASTRCVACGNQSLIHEPFFDISLPIHSDESSKVGDSATKQGNSNSNSLLQCLQEHMSPEVLGASQHRFCPSCRGSHPIERHLRILKLPLVLALHFKRFRFSVGKDVSKICESVQFPEHTLDMAPYMVGNASPSLWTQYELFAVVSHVGTSLHTGHYVAYIRQGPRGSWYKCDDDKVMKVSSAEVLATEAYLLFYSKQSIEYPRA